MNAIRTRWADPDFRRQPKTKRFCLICQRDLKPAQAHRVILWEVDRYEAIAPADWARARVEIAALEQGPIGLDCARQLGLEFSAEPQTEGN